MLRDNTRQLVISLLIITSFIFLAACQSGDDILPAQLVDSSVKRVGFDVDDTLLFSSPAFQEGFRSEHEPFSEEFWSLVNSIDTQVSCIKPKVYQIVKKYQGRGAEIFAITARQPDNGDYLRDYLEKVFAIPAENTFFAPDGKTEKIKELDLDIYFGDSDSDIKDAQAAGITAVRIKRNDQSSYEEKYNPGKYDEIVIEETSDHDCQFKPYE
ncbi:MAG: HAD family acid phosphatase [bacterium]